MTHAVMSVGRQGKYRSIVSNAGEDDDEIARVRKGQVRSCSCSIMITRVEVSQLLLTLLLEFPLKTID